MNENELMQKLALSKAIMQKSDTIKRGSVSEPMVPSIGVDDFQIPQATYNIPQDILESNTMISPNATKPVGAPSIEAIKNSRLPDEIKKLMIEHPITQPQNMTQPTLSKELVEKATKLMGTNTAQKSSQGQTQRQSVSEGIDYKKIERMIENAVNKALEENGLLVESTEKTNETFSFRVGKHIFEGKLTKIKKTS
jgi:hypothetical protein